MSKRSIYFFYEGVEYKLQNSIFFKSWIKVVFDFEKVTFDSLSYIFCSDSYLLELNLGYLQHDTLTDIITFDTSEPGQNVSGDIFISIDRVRENAGYLSVSFDEELRRVMIHGALHLIGYNDKTPKQKFIMRQKENIYLSMFPVKH